jgi:hypothetical protein
VPAALLLRGAAPACPRFFCVLRPARPWPVLAVVRSSLPLPVRPCSKPPLPQQVLASLTPSHSPGFAVRPPGPCGASVPARRTAATCMPFALKRGSGSSSQPWPPVVRRQPHDRARLASARRTPSRAWENTRRLVVGRLVEHVAAALHRGELAQAASARPTSRRRRARTARPSAASSWMRGGPARRPRDEARRRAGSIAMVRARPRATTARTWSPGRVLHVRRPCWLCSVGQTIGCPPAAQGTAVTRTPAQSSGSCAQQSVLDERQELARAVAAGQHDARARPSCPRPACFSLRRHEEVAALRAGRWHRERSCARARRLLHVSCRSRWPNSPA